MKQKWIIIYNFFYNQKNNKNIKSAMKIKSGYEKENPSVVDIKIPLPTTITTKSPPIEDHSKTDGKSIIKRWTESLKKLIVIQHLTKKINTLFPPRLPVKPWTLTTVIFSLIVIVTKWLKLNTSWYEGGNEKNKAFLCFVYFVQIGSRIWKNGKFCSKNSTKICKIVMLFLWNFEIFNQILFFKRLSSFCVWFRSINRTRISTLEVHYMHWIIFTSCQVTIKNNLLFQGVSMFFQKKVFFSKSEVGAKLPKNDSKWFFWASLDPEDDLHPFVDDFWPFKILTFSTFFYWKIGYNTNATRADFFQNLAFFAWFFFDPTLILVGNRQIVKKILQKCPNHLKSQPKKVW